MRKFTGLGFYEDKPIMVKNVQAEYVFLNSIVFKDSSLLFCGYERIGSVRSKKFKGPIDIFIIKGFDKKTRSVFGLDLYITAYPEINKPNYNPVDMFTNIQNIMNNEFDFDIPKCFKIKEDRH